MDEWIVDEEGGKLLDILGKKWADVLSKKGIKRALESRACLVNGQVERFGTRSLKKGDKIVFSPGFSAGRVAKEAPLKLYEDACLLAIDKPPYLVSEDKMIQTLFPEYNNHLWLAHRLDKETSGVLLLVKSLEMRDRFRGLFADQYVGKTYLARVHGKFLRKEGVVESLLQAKGYFAGQTIYRSVPSVTGPLAITHWKVLEESRGHTLVECRPLTGKTHQIRVHMSSIGHPLLGDVQYGLKQQTIGVTRTLLHSSMLKFRHPITKEYMEIHSSIPSDFTEIRPLA